ncbi:MAG TPA: tRNA pseudouridine(38-40) synthase TruA [Puia sp.]|jgi:tRNA pseudouridine38-40 synthase|nr:tRNA pseudouridine(38-40) synthase TruA [Puia sp.]
MSRYFLEVSYKGTNYSGFQIQENANSIQGEMEKALEIYFRKKIDIVCSSRTDTGVHALQNFFHFDWEEIIPNKFLYNIDALLPADIAVKNIFLAPTNASSRFDATSREYKYYVYRKKNPFIQDQAYYFPYTLDEKKLSAAAEIISFYTDFTSFSKRNTQVKNFNCTILHSKWVQGNDCWVYEVKANRFLRGMVRGLVGTMLQVGRGKLELPDFEKIIQSLDCTKADFSVPGHGLFLVHVNYPDGLLNKL